MHRMIQMARRWSELVFGHHSQRITPHVRALRLLEEAVELAQAEGVDSYQAHIILAQVYGKEPNDNPLAELGGVMTTLAAYCATRNFNPEDAFWCEFERIMDPKMMEKVRNRNLYGDKIGLQE